MTSKGTRRGRVAESRNPPKTPEHIDTERRIDMLRVDLDNPSLRYNASVSEEGLRVWNSIAKRLEDARLKLAQHEKTYRRECRRARKRHRVP